MSFPSERTPAALEGIRVLDFSRMLPGPWCTQMLGDLGADVIKIEQPGIGDLGRHNSPNFKCDSVYFNTVNLNKRSLALDLWQAEDREVALSLMDEADVVVETFRVGVTERMGLDYATVKQRNPGVIYCSVTGFGQSGPLSSIPGHDLVVQAVSGVMGVGGADAPPVPAFQAGDYAAASYAAMGIMAALHRRTATGIGAYLDVSMFDALFSMTNIVAGSALARAAGNHMTPPMELWGGNPRYCTYQTRDQRAVAVSLLEARIWTHFCNVIGRPDLINAEEGPQDRHSQHGSRAQLYRDALRDLCLSRDRDELVAWMMENNVPIVPVYSPDEAMAQPHVRSRGLIQWVAHPSEGRIPVLANPLAASGLTAGQRRPAPALGEHNEALLDELRPGVPQS
ncbi:CaiB/BaiF CoA-transferase family protein [Bordetella sp. BOR01]|uniref:CaiB/BaiF CoA transferase family protein n=1 Tax=Bordetella sp. BOR01 TaxID=2854779 RepID=UPI001C46A3F0|nr:CoA transferase [Bordetella sp. BOR01]MBV7483192.1 CoA transferase [Bordetella sp. BOR01]